jgi:hypothetical protein
MLSRQGKLAAALLSHPVKRRQIKSSPLLLCPTKAQLEALAEEAKMGLGDRIRAYLDTHSHLFESWVKNDIWWTTVCEMGGVIYLHRNRPTLIQVDRYRLHELMSGLEHICDHFDFERAVWTEIRNGGGDRPVTFTYLHCADPIEDPGAFF